MNETKGTSRLSEQGNSEQKKPSHVRRLNFGQSILTLHVAKQFQGQKDGALTIDRNVSTIPCTSKGEFVRKWIETHQRLSSVTDTNEPAILSPVLGPTSERGKVKSPILCNRRKQVRKIDSPFKPELCFKHGTCPKEKHMKRGSISENDRKENVRRNLFHSESAVHVVQSSHVAMSPVLGKNPNKSKKKRFVGERKALHRIENKCSDTGSRVVSMNSPILDRNSFQWKRRRLRQPVLPSEEGTGSAGNLICTQKRRALVQKLEDCLKQMNETAFVASDHSDDSPISRASKISGNSKASIQSRVYRDSKISEDSPDPQEKRLSIEESPRDARDLSRMEIEDVPEDNDAFTEPITDDDVESSVRIEDADTQDTFPVPANVSRIEIDGSSSPTLPLTSSSTSSQYTNKDSDRTYFSKAEQVGYSVECLSQKISQISSQLTLAQNNLDRTAESGAIASVGSPQRMPSDSAMQFRVLDSAKKKRRKPKKGSLSEKLQTLISSKASFVRMWRHQVKQATEDNVSMPCVTVHAQNCVSSFSRQFLEGIVIEDPFNLLPSQEESRYPRRIRIMTVPEIVGRIEAKSASVVQIFPPWETLDDKELTLNVTYIKNIVTDDRVVDHEDMQQQSVQRSVVQEFDCSCIRTGKMNLYCRDRYDKPNVMERLFNVEK
ncbi:uncharacterized protein LOC143217408 [Lasioglossum baleicum]|uniref:uncharacterized protein LOC143217408 n=1 Tax=Lasioglossum baleicum TaxID=434251 RepID=UPI003FCE7E03